METKNLTKILQKLQKRITKNSEDKILPEVEKFWQLIAAFIYYVNVLIETYGPYLFCIGLCVSDLY